MQLPEDLIQALDVALEDTRASEVPGAAAAILSPAGNWFGASGVSDVANNTPLQPDDLFEIGSITKTFVATTMLQLVEEGQLSLKDTLREWLPAGVTDLVPNADDITIEQILRHTSGVADYFDVLVQQALSNPTLFLQDWQPQQLVDLIDGLEPSFAPGESWQYSNTNYILAGLVIESVTGNNVAAEIRDRILTPLNLQDTFFAEEEERNGGYIKSYWDFDGNGTLDDLSVTNLSWAWATGAMISNTADLAAFFKGLFKGDLLQPKTLASMLDTIPVDSPNYDSYGLGIGTLESPNRFWYAHRGQTLGFRSNLWYSPAEDITYVELINGSSDDNLVRDLLSTFRSGLTNNNGENPTIVQDNLSTSLPLVSLNTEPDYLVESEGTVSAHVFNVTGGTIPEGGLVVSVSAPNLSAFDLDAIEVTDGGEIVNVRSDGFDIRLTDFTTLINLPVAEEGETEGLETASFTLEAGEGYEVNSDFSSGDFNLVDTRDEIPVSTANEPNDTIPLAIDTGLSSENPQVSLSAAIDFDIGNRYLNENGRYTYVDGIEDVDFYKFELKAGDVIAVDANNGPKGVLDIVQNIFDAEGNILAYDQGDPGPGEAFAVLEDSYLEFEAPEDGTYYLGISAYANGLSNRQVTEPEAAGLAYNPFEPASGTGFSFDAFGYLNIGEYDLTISLNPETRVDPPGFNRNNNTPPDTLDLAQPGEPTVSLGFLGLTFAPLSDQIISQSLVENLPEASLLTFTLQTEGEIPEEGIVVTINSDIYLRDYINGIDLSGFPFSPGSEFIGAVTDDTGLETGFQVRIFEPSTFFGFNARTPYYDGLLEPENDGPEEATFFLEGGEGYGVEPDANQFTTTFYDNLEQVPAPSVIPEVSLSISEAELIESEGTVTTFNFSLSEPPPSEGIIVYVTSENEGSLPQFQVLEAEISGGIFPIPDGFFTGFYFKITEQEASITLPVFADPFAEGLQGYSFTLQETPFYMIDPDAGEIDFTIADTPDSVLEVSLSSETEVLVESENTLSILTFNLTAQPPSEGITVTVEAPNLGEFDVEAIIITGGEITEVTDSGFSLNITEATATIELPVAEDSEAEGLETATFTLIESTNYTINPQANEATFSLYDISEQVPVTEELKENDTIPEAIALNLNSENLTATISGRIYQVDGEESFGTSVGNSDLTEDVDLYSFELQAEDTVKIDVDSIPFELVDGPNGPLFEIAQQQLDSELRLFDVDGNELASVNNAAAPDEEFSRDSYLEFTASEAGTYYVGVSQLGNRNYDPFVEESGSGWSFPEIGVFFGDYELNVSLTAAATDIVGTDTAETLIGDTNNNNIDGFGGNDTLAGNLGNDIILGSNGNDILRGDRNNRSPQDGIAGGNDIIFGGNGSDRIGGKSGNDILKGDAGDDRIWGDDGSDILIGSTGNDILVGDHISSGSDTFVFGNGDGTDTILDFEVDIDRIGLVEGELTKGDLTITQDGSNTLLGVASSGYTLAVLKNVQASALDQSSFEIFPDVSNLNQALALVS